jgi:hypothetical protein
MLIYNSFINVHFNYMYSALICNYHYLTVILICYLITGIK